MKLKIGLDLDGVIIDHTINKIKLAKQKGYFLKPAQTTSEIMKKIVPVFVICDPEEAVRRNLKSSIIKETGSFSSPKSSKKLANIFVNEYQYFKKKNAPVVLIDTTELKKDKQAKLVLTYALDAFERRFGKK